MAGTLSAQDLASESGTSVEFIDRLVGIGALKPTSSNDFQPGDVVRVETVQSFLDAGLTMGDIAASIQEGLFTFEFLDRYYPDPARRSGRTYAELAASLGSKARLLPDIYVSMGLPEPPPSMILRKDEQEVLAEFLEAWSEAGDDETYTRAARLVGEPARIATEGWVNLHVEKIAQPLTAQGIPIEDRTAVIVRAAAKAARLAPKMLLWLHQRHLRSAMDRAIFESLEQELAEIGLSPPRPPRLPAIAFVDLSGYTRLTEERGDELAMLSADLLRDRAEQAARRHDGSLVKLLGDGAMLHFADAASGLAGAVDVVRVLAAADLQAHAGVHAGPLIHRDGDYFGRTVNLASRVAGVADAGEVWVTDAVVPAAKGGDFRFERLGQVTLKGVRDSMALFRAVQG